MRKIELAVSVIIAAIAATGWAATPDPADELVRSEALIRKAGLCYRELSGYQAVFDKEELESDGKWDKEKTFIKFNKPFTIYMGWLEGAENGRQLLYAEGKFDDKMQIRIPGFFNLIPIVQLATDDPRVMSEEKHSIKSAGIGHFIKEFGDSFEESKQKNRVTVLDIRDVEVQGEQGTLVEVWFSDPTYEYPRTCVVFSKEHHLPIEVKLYKDRENLVESYRYLGLEVDPPSDDADFKQNADGRIFNLYQQATS